jgi:endosialidase-like protein
MVRIIVLCLILLAVCAAVPALAQAPVASTLSTSAAKGPSPTVTDVTTTGGTANYLPIFNGTSTVIDSVVSQSGATLDVNGNLSLPVTTSGGAHGVISLGVPILHNYGPSGSWNVFLGGAAGNFSTTGSFDTGTGYQALNASTTGSYNAAVGSYALASNTTGHNSSAFGYAALYHNTSGIQNDAFGDAALAFNTTGNGNAAFGTAALEKNTTGGSSSETGANSAFGNFALSANTTAGGNSAFGYSALTAVTTGNNNVAVGAAALAKLASGSGNIAVGTGAGGNLDGAESNDIYIGSSGEAGESNTIRIGYIGTITAAAIAGIWGKTSASGVDVLVNESGLLGTTTSSRRFKHEISDMGAESDVLMKLRPVSFYYKPELDETQTRQYGLVAEEVAHVAPQLVVFDKDGAPQTVRYRFVNAMLLNEVQKQRQLVEEQQKTNEEQNHTISRQHEEIQDLAARVAKLEELLAVKR